MSLLRGSTIADNLQVVEGLAPITPSSSTPDYISLKDYASVEVLIVVDNGATVTGSAITLKQATAVAGTAEKALPFTRYFANLNTAASTVLVNTTATSNTFTTATGNTLNLMYRIPMQPSMLDADGGFDCLRAGTGDAVNAVVGVYYLCVPKYGGNAVLMPAGITD